jgi:hypothetical protein
MHGSQEICGCGAAALKQTPHCSRMYKSPRNLNFKKIRQIFYLDAWNAYNWNNYLFTKVTVSLPFKKYLSLVQYFIQNNKIISLF